MPTKAAALKLKSYPLSSALASTYPLKDAGPKSCGFHAGANGDRGYSAQGGGGGEAQHGGAAAVQGHDADAGDRAGPHVHGGEFASLFPLMHDFNVLIVGSRASASGVVSSFTRADDLTTYNVRDLMSTEVRIESISAA